MGLLVVMSGVYASGCEVGVSVLVGKIYVVCFGVHTCFQYVGGWVYECVHMHM